MKSDGKEPTKRRSRRASTVEGHEDQMISLAMMRAEERLRDGTASNSMILHFLKLGSTKDRLEREMLQEQIELTKAKTEAVRSAKVNEAMFDEVMKAFKEYNGQSVDDEEYEDIQ